MTQVRDGTVLSAPRYRLAFRSGALPASPEYDAFQFKCPGEHNNEIDLVSLGKDGKEGTADDIKSWEDDDLKK